MDKIPLFPIKKIICDTLECFQVKEGQVVIDAILKNIQKSYGIKTFSNKIFKEFKKKIEDQNVEPENAMRELGINFVYNEEEIVNFKRSLNSKEATIATILNLKCAFISWDLIYDVNIKKSKVKGLLDISIQFVYENGLTINQFGSVMSIIYHIFRFIINNNAIEQLETNMSTFLQLFQQNLTVEYTDILGTALKLIMNFSPEEITPENTHILTVIHQITSNDNHFLSSKLMQLVYGSLTPLIYKLNVPVLSFLTSLSTLVTEEVGMVATSLFPSAVLQYITSSSLDDIDLGFGDLPAIDDSSKPSSVDFVFKFQEDENKSLPLDSKTTIPDKQPVESYLPRDLVVRLKMISKILSVSEVQSSTFFDIYLDLMKTCDSRFIPYLYLSALIILRELPPNKSILLFLLGIHKSVFFDQRVNIFKENENILVSSVRWATLDSLYLTTTTFFFDIMEYLVVKPYIYAETIMRYLQSQHYNDMIHKKELIDLISLHSSYFKIMDGEAATIARGTIMLFFSQLFNSPEYISNFFIEENNSSIFISNIFDNQLREFVIKCISTYLTTTQSLSPCLSSILDTTLQVSILTNTKRGIPLCLELLKSLNDVMAVTKGIDSYLLCLRQTVCQILITISKMEESEEITLLILQSMQFFIITSPIAQTRYEDVSAFETISSIFKDGPPDVLFTKTIQLLAGQQLNSFAPIFTVREPKFLRFLLSEYAGTPKFQEALDYIIKLCGFSNQNISACHAGKLDFYLLEILHKQKMSENVDIELVNSVLGLFTLIASYICSASVVQGYISLFAPLSKTTVSYLQPTFIKGLTSILTSTVKKPSGFFGLNKQGALFEIKGIDSSHLNGGFTFAAWVSIDSESNKYLPNIFTLTDSQNVSISATLNVLDICVNVRGRTSKSNGIVEELFPLKTWVFLTFVFQMTMTETIVYVSFNSKEVHQLDFPRIELTGNVTCTVGGDDPTGKEPEHPLIMGSFGIFNSNSCDRVSTIEASGPQFNSSQIPSVFILRTSAPNKVFMTEFIPCSKDMTITKHGKPLPQLSMINDCLVNVCGVDMIIPLFSQLDLVFPNGKKFDTCAELSIELLFAAIANNNAAQESLAKSKNDSIGIIAHLLSSSDKSNITYSLYTHILTLFQNLNNLALQTEFSKSILFNFDLWYHSNTVQDCLLVLRNWNRNLVPYLRSQKIPTLEFSVLLDTLSTFDGNDEIKKLLCDLVIESAQQSFTQKDLHILISHIINSHSSLNTLLLLDIVICIAQMQNSPLKKVETSCLVNIIYITNCKDKKILAKIVELFIVFCKNPEISICPLHEVIDVLLHSARNDDADQSFYEFLMEKIKGGVYELLPLLSWCAIILGEECVNETFKELDPNIGFAFHSTWAIWPIIAAYQYVNTSVTILQFLSLCSVKQWGIIDSSIEVVGRALKKNSSRLRRDFFIVLTNLFISSTTKEGHYIYFTRILNYIFIHKESTNAVLKDLLRYSPFPIDVDEKKEEDNEDLSIVHSPVDFYINIEHFEAPTSYYFGIKLNKSMMWEDAGLANMLLSVFSEHIIPNLVPSILLLASYTSLFAKAPENFIQNVIKNEQVFGQTDNQILNKKSPNRLALIEKISSLFFKFYSDVSISEQNSIVEFYDQSWSRSSFIISEVESKFTNISPQSIINSKKIANAKKAECARSWALLWCSLSAKRGPWAIVGDDNLNKLHWKKIPSTCRLDINWKHDDHLQASLKRETLINASSETINRIEVMMNSKALHSSVIYDTEILVEDDQKLTKSKLIGSFNCMLITVAYKKQCVFSIFQNGLSIEPGEGEAMIIPSHFIKSIQPRKVDHSETACEIFLWTGKSYFLNFFDLDQSKLIRKLSNVSMPNALSVMHSVEKEELAQITQRWATTKMSNYEYLLSINQISGRTFNDLSQYPIFPWVIADYESETLDLSKIETFRVLSNPPGVITKEKQQLLIDRGEDWEYPSGVSTPGEMASFLVRLEPFTSIRIKMNGGFFDRPDCIFSSLKREWETLVKDQNDTRELTPEFFAMPEFLMNINNFDLGTENGKRINDVELPPYAHNSPMEFIYLNRKALESDYVSNNISDWIDLNFGYKQTGQEAAKCFNLYRQEMYETASELFPKNITSACMQNLGQVPHKLFTEPHPRRWCSFTKQIQTRIIKISFAPALNGLKDILPLTALCYTVKNEKYFTVLFEDRVVSYKQRRSTRNRTVGNYAFNQNVSTASVIDITKSSDLETSTKMLYTPIAKEAKVGRFLNSFIASDECGQRISFVGSSKKVMIPGGIKSISSSGPIVCVGSGGAFTNLFIGEQLDELCTAQAFKAEVVCAAVSSEYSVVVSGTADGAIVISTLNNGTLVKSIDLGSIPEKILITKGFGFIAVFSSNINCGKTIYFLSLYNINGLFIRRITLDFHIKAWQSFTPGHSGIDMIVFANDTNWMFDFEAFTLDFKLPFYKCSRKIIDISVMPNNSILLTTDEGLEIVERDN